MKLKTTFIIAIIFLSVFGFYSCNSCKNKQPVKEVLTWHEMLINSMEKSIPNGLVDTNYVAIWRFGGGGFFGGGISSVLIVEKKQLSDKELMCYYIQLETDEELTFSPKTLDWWISSVYRLNLKNNSGLKFPLDDKVQIKELDSILVLMSEGLDANHYFMKEFNSKTIYPLGINKSGEQNQKYCKVVAQLFGQINKWEKVQALALTEINTEYVQNYIKVNDESRNIEERRQIAREKINPKSDSIHAKAYKIIYGSDDEFIMKEDREVNDHQKWNFPNPKMKKR